MDIGKIQPNSIDVFRNLQTRQAIPQNSRPTEDAQKAESAESSKDESAKSDIREKAAGVQGGLDVEA